MRVTFSTCLAAVAWTTVALLLAEEDDSQLPVDPAAWGSDHVGQAVPAYMTGDECLFCHREIGSTWPKNRHQQTIRPVTANAAESEQLRAHPGGPALVDKTQFLLGTRRVTHFLKRSKDYGKFELLSGFRAQPTTTEPVDGPDDRFSSDRIRSEPCLTDHPRWNENIFGERCAGCHTTGVDATTRAFSAVSIDCYACHGDVDPGHTRDVRRVLLSSQNRDPRFITSICGQCHLRGGTSRSTGLSYPNTFVAGDNLFRDFEIDWRMESIRAMPAIDQHIFLNCRDVALFGKATTCLTCHDVHAQQTDKHQTVERSAICGHAMRAIHTVTTVTCWIRSAVRSGGENATVSANFEQRRFGRDERNRPGTPCRRLARRRDGR